MSYLIYKKIFSYKMEKKSKNICIKRSGKYDTKYKYCISEKDIPSEIIVDDENVLGMGSYGVVLSAKAGNIPLALKLVPLGVEIPTEDCGLKSDGGDCLKYSIQDFKNEINFAKQFGKIDVTPKVYFTEIVDLSKFKSKMNKKSIGPQENSLSQPEKIGVLVLERFGKSIHKMIQEDYKEFIENEDLIFNKTLALIRKLYELGYFNMDSHFGNILYDKDKKDVRLLDLDLYDLRNLTWEEVEQKFVDGWNFEKQRLAIKYGHMEPIKYSDDEDEDEEEEDEDEDEDD